MGKNFRGEPGKVEKAVLKSLELKILVLNHHVPKDDHMSQSCTDDSSSNDQMSTSSIQNSLPDVQMISSNDITMDTASQCSSQPGDRSKPDKNAEDKNEFLGVTCLLPDEPGQYVITNNTNKTIKKQMTRGGKIPIQNI